MNVVVLGAGSFAREVADMCGDLGWRVDAFVVDVGGQPDELLGRPVVWPEELLGDAYVVGLTSPQRRTLALGAEARGAVPATLVHPSASVSRTVPFAGCVVCRGAVVSTGSRVGRGAIVHRGGMVGHDCRVGEGATVGPSAHLTGFVEIGRGAVVGMGAMVREGVRIGAGAVVGMGAVVLRDVPPGETWWGVPARRQGCRS